MTIYIVSAGRSGSGWLCSVLAGCGLKVTHEWTPCSTENPDVVSDTSWVWNGESFLASLTMSDVVVVLDRDRRQREASVTRLIGERDLSYIGDRWEKLKEGLKKLHDSSIIFIDYKDLFTRFGFQAVQSALDIAERDTSNLRNMWDFMVHMKVTNNTSEQEVRESHGL